MSVLYAGILGGDAGEALASRSGAAQLLRVTDSIVELSGVSGGAGIYGFAKNGNEILSTNPAHYSSDNGASFASQSNDLASAGSYERIIHDGTRWVMKGIVSGQAKVAYSTNRANWTVHDITGVTTDGGFAYGDGVYVNNSTGQIQYSTNLSTWAATTGGLSPAPSAAALAFGGGVFVGAESSAIVKCAASNPTAWTRVSLPSALASIPLIIAYNPVGGRFVVMGYTASVQLKSAYSDDLGDTWTENPTPLFISGGGWGRQYGNSIVPLSNGGFIAGGFNSTGTQARAFYSEDGIDFDVVPDASSFTDIRALVPL